MGKKYNFDTFREELVKALEDIYGNRCDVKVRKIPKNNGTELTGISLVIEGDAAGITVYAEELFKLHLEGKSLFEIVLDVLERVKHNRVKKINLDFMNNYSEARKRLFLKLLTRKWNAAMMENCPYEPFLDLMLVPCCFVRINEDHHGLIQINNKTLEEWGIEKSKLLSDTWENSKEISRLNILTMQELMNMCPEDMVNNGDKESLKSYFGNSGRRVIVTNSMKFYGSSVMVFSDNQEAISRRIGGDYYLLPSSVHEWIAVPAGGLMSASDYAAMVKEMNQKEMRPEEVLSNSVYRYDSNRKTLTIVYQG